MTGGGRAHWQLPLRPSATTTYGYKLGGLISTILLTHSSGKAYITVLPSVEQ